MRGVSKYKKMRFGLPAWALRGLYGASHMWESSQVLFTPSYSLSNVRISLASLHPETTPSLHCHTAARQATHGAPTHLSPRRTFMSRGNAWMCVSSSSTS